MKKLAFFIILLSLSGIQETSGQWATAGNHIYNTNSGYVGIGNSSPTALLHVGKNMTEPAITVQNFGGGGGATFRMTDNVSGADWKFKATNAGGFKIRDNAFSLDVIVVEANSAANALYIDETGNIGIGTGNPTARLQVESGDALIDSLTFGRGGGAVKTNSAAGYQALPVNTTGWGNTADGGQALLSNLTGTRNTAVGYRALRSNTEGDNNTATGSNALYNNTTGDNNTANGFQALFSNTTGDSNTAIGYRALYSSATTSHNTALGFYALYTNVEGAWNTAVGSYAGNSNNSGTSNTFLGYAAGYSNEIAHTNVAIGAYALYGNTDRNHLVAIGDSALFHNGAGAVNYFDGRLNTAIGSKSLYSNTTGAFNTACGFHSLYSNTTGFQNTAFGDGALYSNNTGISNTAVGEQALVLNTTGSNNTACGSGALFNNTDRSNLVAIGDSALFNNGLGVVNSYHATMNSAVGSKSLISNTTGYYNSAFGYHALQANSSGNGNTSVGTESMVLNTTGNNNTASGYRALMHNLSGANNAALGFQSMHDNQSGSENTAVGYYSMLGMIDGIGNTAIGSCTMKNIWHGNFNTIIGDSAGYELGGTAMNNVIAIGHKADMPFADNEIMIGNNTNTALYCYAAYNGSMSPGGERDLYVNSTGKIGYLSSSSRYKDNIENMDEIGWIYKLRPVNFTYKEDEQKNKRFGLIAEEVEQVIPELVSYNEKGEPETVTYSSLITPLLKAVQDQQREIEELKARIMELESKKQ